jgi:hypothetical protein
LEPSVKRLLVYLSSFSENYLKRRGVGSDDGARLITLSIPTFGLLMIEVNVVSQHKGR